MSSDLVERLIASINQARAIDRASLLREAAEEIARLRRESTIFKRSLAMLTAYCQIMTDRLDSDTAALENEGHSADSQVNN